MSLNTTWEPLLLRDSTPQRVRDIRPSDRAAFGARVRPREP